MDEGGVPALAAQQMVVESSPLELAPAYRPPGGQFRAYDSLGASTVLNDRPQVSSRSIRARIRRVQVGPDGLVVSAVIAHYYVQMGCFGCP